ncbi:hypothetical protein CNEO_1360011 [Clostridium neonatale]|nr:hypothetical protein CNEO_1360011 [Clostridium neonatale]
MHLGLYKYIIVIYFLILNNVNTTAIEMTALTIASIEPLSPITVKIPVVATSLLIPRASAYLSKYIR